MPVMQYEWRGKKVIVVGAARQGLALARYLLLHGAHVTINDRSPEADMAKARQALADLSSAGYALEWVLGGHPLSLLEEADWVCISGGVSATMPLVVEARQRGIAISNDSQIFMEEAPCPTIGITGSAGKTTTTTLVGRMALAAADLGRIHKAWIGGNIGSPLISTVDEMQADDLAVVEFSSFQLELMTRSPQVAAVLNITPNHLDRHGTMEAYTEAKAHIVDFQVEGDMTVLGRDDPGAWSLRQRTPGRLSSFGFSPLPADAQGVFLDGAALRLRSQGYPMDVSVLDRQSILLRGEHNVLNVMAACAIAAAANLPLEAMRQGVEGFRGAPHRLEFVRTWGGADWYNDSIATAPERTMADIRSFSEPLVLLAGGRDKNLPWEDFAHLVCQRVDHLIVFGEASVKILQSIADAGDAQKPTITACKNLAEAVQAAAQIVQPGDVVLLSPGGTSFDEFKDFEERGACFAKWVRELP